MLLENCPFKSGVRVPSGSFRLENASLHNLSNVSVDIPFGVFGVIAGVAGSGKSSLMECFRRSYPRPEDIVYISQKNIGVSLRSTPATYMEVAGDIRKMFARQHHIKEEYFTFNGWGTAKKTIDHIWFSGIGSCTEFETVTKRYMDRTFISDHFPVKATFIF